MIVGASSRTSASTSRRKPLTVGAGVTRLEDAAVDAASQMLDEGPEQAAIGHRDGLVAVKQNMDFTHACLPPESSSVSAFDGNRRTACQTRNGPSS